MIRAQQYCARWFLPRFYAQRERRAAIDSPERSQAKSRQLAARPQLAPSADDVRVPVELRELAEPRLLVEAANVEVRTCAANSAANSAANCALSQVRSWLELLGSQIPPRREAA